MPPSGCIDWIREGTNNEQGVIGECQMARVKNDIIWGQIRLLFLVSAVLFLVNIYFGFDNALTTGLIPRWQILVHLHAGTLGWVTLSAIGLMFWFFTGQQDVGEEYPRRVRAFSWSAIAVFTGYILNFGLAFGLGRPWFYLLPIFGIASLLVIWTSTGFAIAGLRRQPAMTTTHLLITAGLFVASIGSMVGVLLGLEYLIGFFLPGSDRLGAHAAVMDAYLLLFAAAIVEAFLGKDRQEHWTWAGLALTLVWSLAAIFVLVGILFDSQLGFLFVPLLLVGLLIFLARSGWRALRVSLLGQGPERWFFFGTLWATLWALFFIYIGVTYAQNLEGIPDWAGLVFQHSSFVGMMTNLLLGVYSIRSRDAAYFSPWAETIAMWLINLGIPAFFVLRLSIGSRLGAIVMGTGVLLGVTTMITRLLLSDLRWVYNRLYLGRAPWEMDGPRSELIEMVESGWLQPCRAIDLGCGTGDNAIFLARHGFDVVGVDLSPRAIARARAKAREAGVALTFITGDVTELKDVEGTFDLVLDYGCLGCVIGMPARKKYAETLLRLTRAGASYVLLNFAQNPSARYIPLPNALNTGQVDRLFKEDFVTVYSDDEYDTGPCGMPVEFRVMRRR
jgi:SAM-dependent methyltransferase